MCVFVLFLKFKLFQNKQTVLDKYMYIGSLWLLLEYEREKKTNNDNNPKIVTYIVVKI